MHEELDSCRYLYLRELSEPEDNSLRLVVEEARPNRELEDIRLYAK
jgi:hypothetical protein